MLRLAFDVDKRLEKLSLNLVGVLQTLEHAFLQLCETTDQKSIMQTSSPQSGQLENSQSFEGGREENQPILAVGPPAGDELPRFSGSDRM